MRRSVYVLAFLFPLLPGIPAAAFAQDRILSDQEKLGARLFDQSCVVCHKRQQITSGTYGPVLSRETLGGKSDIMREIISNGTPRMPAFKIQFVPAEIDAIVAYLESIPAPAAAPRTGKAGGAGEPD